MSLVSVVNTSGSGCIAPRTVNDEPLGFRVAQYPDGSKRIQGKYQWSQGYKWGFVWKDLPLVYVDAAGEEVSYG